MQEQVKEGLGLSFTFLTAVLMVSHPFLHWWYGVQGAVIAWLGVLSMALLDYFTAPLSKKNIQHMQQGGFSMQYIATCAAINLSIYWIPMAVPIWLFATPAVPRFDMELICNVAAILSVTELWFTPVHKLLHRHFAELHLMHHFCDYCSFTSNLLFHPLDIFLEFGFPLLLNGVIGGWYFKDTFAMIIGYSIIGTWYVLDHDQYLQTEHWKHHRYCSGRYSAYLVRGECDPDDAVKPLMRSKKQH